MGPAKDSLITPRPLPRYLLSNLDLFRSQYPKGRISAGTWSPPGDLNVYTQYWSIKVSFSGWLPTSCTCQRDTFATTSLEMIVSPFHRAHTTAGWIPEHSQGRAGRQRGRQYMAPGRSHSCTLAMQCMCLKDRTRREDSLTLIPLRNNRQEVQLFWKQLEDAHFQIQN